MKLNAASELLPLSLGGFQNIHPLAPKSQTQGYNELIEELGEYLKEITGFAGVSFQPNSGAAGEYAGLMTIRKYLESIGQGHIVILSLSASAHGTNPASAISGGGYETVTIECDSHGNIAVEDLQAKADQHKDHLAGCMITYPSTHGIFEERLERCARLYTKKADRCIWTGRI